MAGKICFVIFGYVILSTNHSIEKQKYKYSHSCMCSRLKYYPNLNWRNCVAAHLVHNTEDVLAEIRAAHLPEMRAGTNHWNKLPHPLSVCWFIHMLRLAGDVILYAGMLFFSILSKISINFTFMTPRILRWFLNFWKSLDPWQRWLLCSSVEMRTFSQEQIICCEHTLFVFTSVHYQIFASTENHSSYRETSAV